MRRSFAPSALSQPGAAEVPMDPMTTPVRGRRAEDHDRENLTRERVIIRGSFMPLLSIPRGNTYLLPQKLLQPFKSPIIQGSSGLENISMYSNNIRTTRSQVNQALQDIEHGKQKRLGCIPLGRHGEDDSFSLLTRKFMMPGKYCKQENGGENHSDSEEETGIHKIKTPPYVPLVLWDKEKDIFPVLLIKQDKTTEDSQKSENVQDNTSSKENGVPALEPKLGALQKEDGKEPTASTDQSQWDAFKPYLKDQVIVPECIGRFLRPHQREGVKFLFDCVLNLSRERYKDGFGCILADDMGLGKTLQSITLLFTLLTVSFLEASKLDELPASNFLPSYNKSVIKKVVIVCPTSLVKNWENEITKWLQGRLQVLAVLESVRKKVIKVIKRYLSTPSIQVLILSYDTFRLHSKLFYKAESGNQISPVSSFGGGKASVCDLLICDEAHRLKNGESLISKALDGLSCKRRVLLSGTPMQNDLEEFYSMVNFCNPDLLSSVSKFRKSFINPIVIGRDPYATEKQIAKAENLTEKLSQIVNAFILRRTNTLNVKYLPPKLTQVVCVNLSPLQQKLYKQVLSNKVVENLAENNLDDSRKRGTGGNVALNSINLLKKICNHGQLVFKPPKNQTFADVKRRRTAKVVSYKANASEDMEKEEVADVFQLSEVFAEAGYELNLRSANVEVSSKFQLVLNMLNVIRKERLGDRIVIVSNYTQTLELLGLLCKEKGINYVRLDGSVSMKKRNQMVEQLNARYSKLEVFLLSSKAGGCGLNLIGANRLILFDPDWNPATDKQAAARVWREGQAKNTFVYRFLATGTIEEKIFQRQVSKNGLQSVVAAEIEMESSFSSRDLKDIFSLKARTFSDTHDKLSCQRCVNRPDFDKVFNSVSNGEKGSPQKKDFSPPRKKAVIIRVEPTKNCDQVGFPKEDELDKWSHCYLAECLDDDVLQKAAKLDAATGRQLVTFVFAQYIDGAQMSDQDEEPQKVAAPSSVSVSETSDENLSDSGESSISAEENSTAESVEAEDVEAEDVEAEDMEAKNTETEDVLIKAVEPESVEVEDVEAEDVKPINVEIEDVFIKDIEVDDADEVNLLSQEISTFDLGSPKWSCRTCTLENSLSKRRCEACGQRKEK